MEARLFSYFFFTVLAVNAFAVDPANQASAASTKTGNFRTRNFLITAPTQELATQVGFAAEKYRKSLAVEWLGKELPDWPQPCSIKVNLNRLAFGETSFSFSTPPHIRSAPFDFVMTLNGTEERILDSVLPHEVTHTIFATYFGTQLPRWADEGACTTVEHVSERRKNHRVLIEVLTTERGIPFNRMFAMKQYPRDILALYAQGYSLSRFLIQRGGKRKFVQFIDEGLKTSQWGTAVRNHYKIDDLSKLQTQWIAWVKAGCPAPDGSGGTRVAAATKNSNDRSADQRADLANQVATKTDNPTQQATFEQEDSKPSQQLQFVSPANAMRQGASMSNVSTNQPRPTNVGSNRNNTSSGGGSSLEESFYFQEMARAKSQTVIR